MVKSLNIIIIEDSASDIVLIKHNLIKHFPEVVFTICNSRMEFIEKIEWLMPDIILCDYQLPDTNGLEMLLFIKEKWDVPVIFVTGALNDEEKVALAILKGASGYVLKSNLGLLPQVVDRVLECNERTINLKNSKVHLLDDLELQINKLSHLATAKNVDSEIAACIEELQSNFANIIHICKD